MNHFFATFPAGAGEIVEEILRERGGGLQVLALMDGAVEFSAELPYSDLNFFCFHNVFQVLGRAGAVGREKTPDEFLREILSGSAAVDWRSAAAHPKKVRSFRVVVSRQNQLAAVDREQREKLEQKLSRISGMRVDRSGPDTEFWLLSRREGRCYFLKRLSKHTAYDKLLHPGELHPELAFLLCWLTRPLHTDIVVDPFCGYGAIPLQRCKRFPFRALYAFDVNAGALAETRKKLPERETVVAERRDFFALRREKPELFGAVDAVVTDPPWGLYEDVPMELSEFYRRMLLEISAMLKVHGRAVVLTAGKEEFRAALGAVPDLKLCRDYHVLVSGKKCGIYLLHKKS